MNGSHRASWERSAVSQKMITRQSLGWLLLESMGFGILMPLLLALGIMAIVGVATILMLVAWSIVENTLSIFMSSATIDAWITTAMESRIFGLIMLTVLLSLPIVAITYVLKRLTPEARHHWVTAVAMSLVFWCMYLFEELEEYLLGHPVAGLGLFPFVYAGVAAALSIIYLAHCIYWGVQFTDAELE